MMDGLPLEPIFSAWALDPQAPVLEVVDVAEVYPASGGTSRDGDPMGVQIGADIMVNGTLAGRLVATGGRVGPGVRGPVEALAAAIGALAAESRAREAAERALQDHRAHDAAQALGIDAAELAKGRIQQRRIVTLEAFEVPGYGFASHYSAAHEIGGDFFELFRIPRRGRPVGIVVADVTGKGLDAALLMAFARPVMHTALCNAPGPADALARTNRVLVGEHRGTLFITALAGVLHPPSGRLRIASAGHEAPLLIPSDGGPVTEVGRAGTLLGAWDAVTAPEAEITLAPGDKVVLYTDGVTDARSESGEQFGDERLLAAIEAARAGSEQDMVASISRERGGVLPCC